jgi:hypothetical protein
MIKNINWFKVMMILIIFGSIIFFIATGFAIYDGYYKNIQYKLILEKECLNINETFLRFSDMVQKGIMYECVNSQAKINTRFAFYSDLNKQIKENDR